MLDGSYNLALVTASYLVAALGSFASLQLTINSRKIKTWRSHLWLMCSGITLGLGTWAMHFIGMLSFELPILIAYDQKLTAASLAVSVACSTVAFSITNTKKTNPSATRLLFASSILAGGVFSMHVIGMQAMLMQPAIEYDNRILILSWAIASIAAAAALKLSLSLKAKAKNNPKFLAYASLLMGAGISGMHYTGMTAANFSSDSICGAVAYGINGPWLIATTIFITTLISAALILASTLDSKLQTKINELSVSTSANMELRQKALHDDLTELPNRLSLERSFSQLTKRANLELGQFAVIFLDIDGFKLVNDALGHQAGDNILCAVSRRLKSLLRADDTIARIGGDEFVILTWINSASTVETLANKLLENLREPFQYLGDKLSISGSLGIAIYPRDGTTSVALIMHADSAMYSAKKSGKNSYRYYDESLGITAHQNLMLTQDLREGIKNKEFLLDYQLKFDAKTMTPIGAEALIRWKHPKLGILQPRDFITLAETSGLILDIGDIVIQEACKQLANWALSGRKSWHIAINLSAIQFFDESLTSRIQYALERHSITGELLILEITESVAMINLEAAIQTMHEISKLGPSFAIDDFGSGHSSLLYLKKFPVAEIKLDKEFLAEVETSTATIKIINSIISLGHSLNLRVVLEGIESEYQKKIVTEAGADILQGYYLARPMPASHINDFAQNI